MICNLGDFRSATGRVVDWAQERRGQRGDSGILRKLLDTRAQDGAEQRPDLLVELGPGHPDHVWLQDVHDALVERGAEWVRLDVCDHEPDDAPGGGFTAVAGTLVGLARRVRRDDVVQAGFAALRDAEHGLRIWPRLYRVVCANGAFVLHRNGGDARRAGETVGEVIARCLDPRIVGAGAQDFLRASRRPVDDPLRVFLDVNRRAGRQLPPERRFPIIDRFHDAGDTSLWGLINAVTADARAAPNGRLRFQLEEYAGHLARLVDEPPARTRSAARETGFENPMEASMRRQLEQLRRLAGRCPDEGPHALSRS